MNRSKRRGFSSDPPTERIPFTGQSLHNSILVVFQVFGPMTSLELERRLKLRIGAFTPPIETLESELELMILEGKIEPYKSPTLYGPRIERRTTPTRAHLDARKGDCDD